LGFAKKEHSMIRGTSIRRECELIPAPQDF